MAETPAITDEATVPMVRDLILACQEVLRLWPAVSAYHTDIPGEALMHRPMQRLAAATAHLQSSDQARQICQKRSERWTPNN
mgnify:CR=1 FL=1